MIPPLINLIIVDYFHVIKDLLNILKSQQLEGKHTNSHHQQKVVDIIAVGFY